MNKHQKITAKKLLFLQTLVISINSVQQVIVKLFLLSTT